MKFKIDECLPIEIAGQLKEKGFNADTVNDESLGGSSDEIIQDTVLKEDRFLITADLDFSDMRKFKPGTHSGILILRLNKEGKNYILSYIKHLLSSFDFNDWSRCFIIASDHKIRVNKPD